MKINPLYHIEIWAEEHEAYWLMDVIAKIDWRLRGIRCVFIGHKVMYGAPEEYTGDWCDRCYRPEDMYDIHEEHGPNTIPTAYAILREKVEDIGYRIQDWMRGLRQ